MALIRLDQIWNWSYYFFSKEFQKYQKEISEINAELLVGSSVILCLIHNTKMYICNIGTCRALLCKYDENNAPRVVQFSDDHNLDNPEEIMRLSRLGLDRDALAQCKSIFSILFIIKFNTFFYSNFSQTTNNKMHGMLCL